MKNRKLKGRDKSKKKRRDSGKKMKSVRRSINISSPNHNQSTE
jgi:hypothetical protein